MWCVSIIFDTPLLVVKRNSRGLFGVIFLPSLERPEGPGLKSSIQVDV